MLFTQCFFLKQKGGGTSAEGVSIEAPRERGVGRGQIPSPEIFSILELRNRYFCYILSAIL